MSHPDTPAVGHAAETHAQRTITSCMDVYNACQQTAAYCVDQRADYADPHRVQVLYDCADSHLMAANFLIRASPFSHRALRLAASIAQACMDAFAEFEHDDAQLRKLYAVCAQSTQALRAFVGDAEAAPENDARDETLKETFPASDPAPPPTEV